MNWLSILFFAFILAGCGGGSSSGSKTSNVNVSITKSSITASIGEIPSPIGDSSSSTASTSLISSTVSSSSNSSVGVSSFADSSAISSIKSSVTASTSSKVSSVFSLASSHAGSSKLSSSSSITSSATVSTSSKVSSIFSSASSLAGSSKLSSSSSITSSATVSTSSKLSSVSSSVSSLASSSKSSSFSSKLSSASSSKTSSSKSSNSSQAKLVEIIKPSDTVILAKKAIEITATFSNISASSLEWSVDPKENTTVEIIETSSTSQTIKFSASEEGRYSVSLQSKNDTTIKETISIYVEYQDVQTFTEDQTVEVFLNYESFKEAGFVDKFSDFTQENLESAIRICIDQWIQNTGINLNIRYMGLKEGYSKNGEIVVMALSKGSNDNTLANTIFGQGANKSNIKFWFTGVSENERDWTVFQNGHGYPLLNVLIHEMGHALGFQHNMSGAKLDTVMQPEYTHYSHSGPHIDDVKDVMSVYGIRDPLDLYLLKNGDDGKTWEDITGSSNITSVGIESSLPIGMNRDDERFLLFYTDLKTHNIKNCIADIDGLNWTAVPFEVTYSKYGVSVNGYNNEYMVAWTGANKNRIEIRYSSDGGVTWVARNPDYENDVSSAGGTPAIHKLGSNKWILSYLKIGKDNKIVSRISFDDGKTWGDEIELLPDENLRGIRGVGITSNGTENIRIVFSATANESNPNFASVIITLNARLDDGGHLVGVSRNYNTSAKTDTEPSITSSMNTFLIGYRNEYSDLKVRYGEKEGTKITGSADIDDGWNKVAPTVVASKNRNRIFMLRME